MIVDLASSGFTSLILIITLEASPDEVRNLWESVGLPPGHRVRDGFHCLEMAGFRRRGRYYRMDARLTTSGNDNPSLTLTYASLEEIRRNKARRANLDKIGRLLHDLASPCAVVCLAHADVPLNLFKPLVGLPLLRFNMPHEYFDEVRGIRVVKLKDNVESDSVALDMHEEGKLHVYAQTTYTTTLGSDIASDALTRMARLRGCAVTEV